MAQVRKAVAVKKAVPAKKAVAKRTVPVKKAVAPRKGTAEFWAAQAGELQAKLTATEDALRSLKSDAAQILTENLDDLGCQRDNILDTMAQHGVVPNVPGSWNLILTVSIGGDASWPGKLLTLHKGSGRASNDYAEIVEAQAEALNQKVVVAVGDLLYELDPGFDRDDLTVDIEVERA